MVNPGGYKFKNELAGKNGKDVHYLGRFDAHGSTLNRWFVESADALRSSCGLLKKRVKMAEGSSIRPEAAADKTSDKLSNQNPQANRAPIPATDKRPTHRPTESEFQSTSQRFQCGENEKEKMDASLR